MSKASISWVFSGQYVTVREASWFREGEGEACDTRDSASSRMRGGLSPGRGAAGRPFLPRGDHGGRAECDPGRGRRWEPSRRAAGPATRRPQAEPSWTLMCVRGAPGKAGGAARGAGRGPGTRGARLCVRGPRPTPCSPGTQGGDGGICGGGKERGGGQEKRLMGGNERCAWTEAFEVLVHFLSGDVV